jgi:chromosome segregation ATPase
MRSAWALALILFSAMTHAQQSAEIWRCVDNEGKRHYTNSKRETVGMKQCELVTSQQINVAPAQKSRPSSFPRESSSDRASAKGRQREILQRELASEEAALARAQKALAEQEAVRSGDERNYARVQERLQPYKETVENHQKNIQALQRELGNLKN